MKVYVAEGFITKSVKKMVKLFREAHGECSYCSSRPRAYQDWCPVNNNDRKWPNWVNVAIYDISLEREVGWVNNITLKEEYYDE